jgi:GNAT superfamily N-acetyltransferase
MDLTNEIPFHDHKNPDYQFIEVKLEDLTNKTWFFAVPSRKYKSLRYLKKGVRNFAVAEGKTIVGDVWCTTTDSEGHPIPHDDAYIMGIFCNEWEIYAMGMFIDPAYRGKNLAAPLQRFLQSTLKDEGYTKVYGFYWQDNIDAFLMHRMLKFKELPLRQVSRFFMFTQAKDYTDHSK